MDPTTLATTAALYVPYVIAAAAVIAPFMPGPERPTGLYAFAYWAVNWLAINRGHATNLNSPAVKGVVAGPGANDAPLIAVAAREARVDEPPVKTP